MSTMALDREIAELVEALSPAAAVIQNKNVKNVVNRSGGVERDAILPHLPTLTHEWSPSTPSARFVPQVSRIMSLNAYATTPPSSGNCVVTLTIVSPGSGSATIGTVTILNGQSSGERSLAYTAPAGSWLFAVVTTANGASGVSIAATRRIM